MTNKLIKRSAISRRKNLLSALDKAFNELECFTDWNWDSNKKLRVYLTRYAHFNSGV